MLGFLGFFLFETVLCEGGNEIHLGASDYTKLFNDVNNGTTYEGTTVFMEADLDFTAPLPYASISMGREIIGYFKGTLDGQGHVIRNLEVTHPAVFQYAGQFGYSKGMTVRNVVFDSTCKTESTGEYKNEYPIDKYSFDKDTYIGGIMGYCISDERPCIIENVVNMGSISFNHNITANLYLGGIAGSLVRTNHEVIVRNCANYGSISLTNSTTKLYMGGIVGYSNGFSSNSISIQNCLNYGELSNTWSGNNFVSMGGIVGEGGFNSIENCLSGGEIFSSSLSTYIGSIIGSSSSKTNIAHTYWTAGTGQEGACGRCSGLTADSFLITPSTITVNDLNKYVLNNGGNEWNKWVLNENNNEVTFHINATNSNNISINSQIILLPSTIRAGYTFHWYTDAFRDNLFDSNSVPEDTTLYGGVAANTYAVTFDFRGGESSSSGSGDNTTRTVTYGEPYGELPEVTKTECIFNGWFTEADGRGREVTPETIVTIPNDYILYANWTTNTYTVTFDFGNGTTTDASFEYNTPIDYPENSSVFREGHTFTGWVPYTLLMPAHDLIITANWTEIPKPLGVNSTEFVEIVFSMKDMKDEEDAKKIIAKYTNDNITIARFERDEDTGYIRVIAKFTDREQAENFYARINNSSEKRLIIRDISFIHDISSFSPSLLPLTTFLLSVVLI